MRKVLWIVDGDQNKFLERAKYVRAQAVCIRTINAWLKGSVQDIKKQGLDVYAWRWPSVDPNSNARHHYVEDEIEFVEGLIAEGLDGYIVDPESDDGRDSDDWNDAKWAGLADHFCDAIKSAGRQKNPDFLFGTTSGCDYPVIKPKIPWSTFLAYSDAVYPQIYWAPDYITAKRTTPDAAWKIGTAAWKKIVPAGMPVHPILGEIGTNTPDELARFGQIMIDNKNTDEVHFYTYEDQLVAPAWSDTWDALRSFGTAVAGLGAPKAPASAKIANQKEEKMPTGLGMLQRARQHIHEDYVLGVVAPKNNPNWRGPWDCAEFTSWLVYQEARVLYGCVDDNSLPAVADAYTGAWTDDSSRLGTRIPVAEAAGTVGGIVLRFPAASGGIVHIAICDGQGGTVEAKGAAFGVVADTVQDRYWDTGVKIPGVQYAPPVPFHWSPPAQLYWLGGSNLDPVIVTRIQQALAARGFDPGPIDGDFGYNTEAAVAAFQATKGLVVDGQVGTQTASALGVALA